ncbi:lipid-binding SYLF domain-containing protein [Brytella acorum]|uniref:Lipid-binding SYLF domain-containing protein n=1 Tax=Brytella acorum TaxID=2959299 RepID=A0AA35V427_9PROT|nr:lipid-binding SYLF domain-containing protein [Brytella acorum]MDF3623952.1 lipid-binding SYLF domain-containing protein [Brytella acorum]CAI9122208.1 lipid-binding SYLF domain-containing protein [Brytella acorum]
MPLTCHRLRFGLTALLAIAPLLIAPGSHAATSQQSLIDRATLAVQDIFQNTTAQSSVQKYLAKSRAVLICPSIFRMSFGIGGSGGGCLLLSRDARGSWSDPAFYTLSSGSIGIQFGMEDSEMMLFVMSDRGLQALLDSQFKFNAGASASFATVGTGFEDSTAGVSNTDILAIQKSKGLFAGASLGGSKLTVNSAANRSYYNQTVGPEDIVVTMRVNNPGADPLRSILTRVAITPVATSSVPAVSPTTSGNSVSGSPYPANYDSRKSYSSQVGGRAVQSETLSSPR